MSRVNCCKACGSTDPPSGWAGTNHNRCRDCCPPPGPPPKTAAQRTIALAMASILGSVSMPPPANAQRKSD